MKTSLTILFIAFQLIAHYSQANISNTIALSDYSQAHENASLSLKITKKRGIKNEW